MKTSITLWIDAEVKALAQQKYGNRVSQKFETLLKQDMNIPDVKKEGKEGDRLKSMVTAYKAKVAETEKLLKEYEEKEAYEKSRTVTL